MPNIDIKNLMLLKEPYEIVLDYFNLSSSHFLNNMNLSLFRSRLFILFLLLAMFKIVSSNMGIVSKLLNVSFVAILGIVMIEALIRLFSLFARFVERKSLAGIIQFIFAFFALIVILGVF